MGRGRFVDDGDDFENADASWITANNDDRRSRYLGIKEILVVVSKNYLGGGTTSVTRYTRAHLLKVQQRFRDLCTTPPTVIIRHILASDKDGMSQ